MENKKSNAVKWSIISVFVGLYLMTSIVSTIHVIDFFRISNPNWLALSIAIAFEVGAAASLASIIVLDKMNKFIVWSLFFILTAMQAIGNTYFAYTHLSDFSGFSELFGLSEEEPIFQKRILSIISGAILPLVSLGFIKALVDYIRPEEKKEIKLPEIETSDVSEEDTPEIKENEPEEENKKVEPKKLKDTIYYDIDPTKIT